MPNPVAFQIFGIEVRWYGVLIGVGILLAGFISMKKSKNYNIDQEDILDIALICVPVGIIGARLYYVIFQWDMYKGQLSEIFNVRGGGLAIHGGLIFGILVAFIICRYKKISFWNVGDIIIPQVALAQAIGRWGNFFNGEAHGYATKVPWAINVNGEAVHPTFLYESIWCLILFIVLSYILKKRTFEGQIICMYGILYSFERFFVEGLRTDSLMIGSLKQAQVFSILVIILCGIMYFVRSKKNKKRSY